MQPGPSPAEVAELRFKLEQLQQHRGFVDQDRRSVWTRLEQLDRQLLGISRQLVGLEERLIRLEEWRDRQAEIAQGEASARS